MKLIFMGSPDFAVPSLEALRAAGHEIVCVYSQPPRPAGRGQAERKTPIHQLAEARGLPVRTPRRLKSLEEQQAFAALGADLAVVVAYGLILPQPVLDAPRLGCLNLHGSLLPRWRGAAPIQRALMAGDKVTGVMAMKMEEGLDTGPVLLAESVPIAAQDTAATLHDRLAAAGAPLLTRAVAMMERGAAQFTPQSAEGVTYAEKITPAEARIDWTAPAREIDLKIRGLSPFPGAWFMLNGARVKALMSRAEEGKGAPGAALDDSLLIACGDGAVRLLRVQREGKGAMAAEAFLRGAPVRAGEVLS
ncbi:MAG TPA: methionyl-tRNA formyltransferase [Caulobacterales bacterium]|nr:methionyl-tRNA formyltransferase [Caulobacterales bacterium]